MVSKRHSIQLAKWGVVVLCLLYLYNHSESFHWKELMVQLDSVSTSTRIAGLLAILFLGVINWYYDTLLWLKMAKIFQPTLFTDALKFNLMAHSAGIVTPNNLGEYGIRALQFSALNERKSSVLLTFSYRMSKWLVKIGFAGLAIFPLIELPLLWSSMMAVALFLLIFVFYWKIPRWLDLLHRSRLGRYFFSPEELQVNWDFSTLNLGNTIIPSTFKFLSYTLQLVIVLEIIHPFDLYETMSRSIILYSGASLIPTIGLFDAAVKISIGTGVFPSNLYAPSAIALALSLIWLINAAIPAFIGSVLLLGHTSKSTTKPM